MKKITCDVCGAPIKETQAEPWSKLILKNINAGCVFHNDDLCWVCVQLVNMFVKFLKQNNGDLSATIVKVRDCIRAKES